jgi:signal-transduction protein with cAMP-binding, CBS, and nucleotidyltransferase domain
VWQGEPHKLHVFVIQQGTVSLWDEADGRPVLRDVRGPGDILGVERFYGAPWCLYSVMSASDVVIYSFPASDFEDLVLKYPYARQFVEAPRYSQCGLRVGEGRAGPSRDVPARTSSGESPCRPAQPIRACVMSRHRCCDRV